MASFFQPSVSGSSSDIAADTKFEILWNATLPKYQLTRHWYQILVLALGCTAICIGCVSLVFQYIRGKRRSKENLIPWRLSKHFYLPRAWTGRGNNALEGPWIRVCKGDKPDSRAPICSTKLGQVKTFCLYEEEVALRGCQPGYDLHIVALTGRNTADLPPQSDLNRTHTTTSSRLSTQGSFHRGLPTETPPSSFGSVDHGSTVPSTMQDSDLPVSQQHHREHVHPKTSTISYGALKFDTYLSGKSISEKALLINSLRLRQGLSGVVFSYSSSDTASEVNKLLRELRHQHVSVILMGDPDLAIVDSINFGLIDGVVVQNASILPNGQRRDFFRASQVRECVARGKRQLKSRSIFFIGFIELWDIQPSAATLRRAFKLADFFGATIQAQSSLQPSPRIEMCLSAFDWLKRPEIIQLQKSWSHHSNYSFSSTADSISLDVTKIAKIISGAVKLLDWGTISVEEHVAQKDTGDGITSPDYASYAPRRDSMWEESSCGVSLSDLGCYNLRDQVTSEHYERILRGQRDLKRLQMLHVYADIEVLAMSKVLRTIMDRSSHSRLLQTLLDELSSGQIQVYKGLDSGFSLPDSGGHFIGLSDGYREEGQQKLDIYISQKNCHDAATIWHVFLAHHGVPRQARFEEELLFLNNDDPLPKSIRSELQSCTEAELLSLMEQIRLTNSSHPIYNAIVQACSHLLLEESSRAAWVALHSRACLDGSSSIRTLLQSRLIYYARSGAQERPSLDDLTDLYNLLEHALEEALFTGDRQTLTQLSAPLVDVYSNVTRQTQLDCRLDLYGLIFFCALRRLAFKDVYLETTDRCPLFLQQHDQAGIFAELWVLGSQCEIYFGILPRELGEIIYEKYHEHLSKHPPPPGSWNGKDVFTAYSNTQPRIKVETHETMTGSGSPTELPGQSPGYGLEDPEKTKSLLETASQFGALSIFCLPAVIDVVLLSFLGRGLYLTAFMEGNVVSIANYAILTALLMTGGITGWVGSTGGFYLFSFAFDNMAHFLVQRFSAAFVLTTVVAFCGFFAFGSQISWFTGFIFITYLFALTTFLNLLGIFATMHRLGCPLTSGRTAMWRCIPVLFISPILTSFVNGHDLLIYLLVVYTFIVLLLITFRNLCHEWTTWLAKVPNAKEKDLSSWYQSKIREEAGSMTSRETSNDMANARLRLSKEIHDFEKRNMFQRVFNIHKDADPFVRKMAIGLPYALWILEKDSFGAELPEIFTTTWFVQLELAVANQKQLMRGLKEHSSFISFRYAKYDLGQNVGLFLGALMDRWIDIVMSAREPPINVYFDNRARYGICFGLLYFLTGAVAVDAVLQRYWPFATKLPDEKLTGLDDFNAVMEAENRLHKKHYRNALVELFTFLSTVFGITTILLWAFVIDHRSIILYFAYISGYTGVLVFQFNRCFTKSPRAHVIVVLLCCLVGFIVGCILRAVPSTAGLFYDYVIGLNAATVPAAICTFLLTGYIRLGSGKSCRSSQSEQPTLPHEEERLTGRAKGESVSCDVSSAGCTGKDTICDLTHKIHCKILQHVCLDIDVNTQWSKVPEDVRRLILCRLLGVDGQMTKAAQSWLSAEVKNIDRSNHNLASCLEVYNIQAATMKESATALKRVGSYSSPVLSSALHRDAHLTPLRTRVASYICQTIYDIAQWTAIISGAAPDTSRELWFALRNYKLRSAILIFLLRLWRFSWWNRRFWTYSFLIAGKPALSSLLSLTTHGSSRALQGTTITIETPLSSVTGFITRDRDENLSVAIFDGVHTALPQSKFLKAIAIYDSSYRLIRIEDGPVVGSPQSVRTFHYNDPNWRRWPTFKTVKGSGREIISNYDKHGRVVNGKIFRGELEFSYDFVYRKIPKGNADILKATYVQEPIADPPLMLSVFWCVQPRAGSGKVKHWIPSEKIQKVVAIMDGKTFEITWVYKHARDPDRETIVMDKDGLVIPGEVAPSIIMKDEFGLFKKPQNLSFDQEDLLVYHPLRLLKRFPRNACSRTDNIPRPAWLLSMLPFTYSPLKKKTVYRKLPTSLLRTALWTRWSKPPHIDAVSACLLDEMILRQEPLLKKYWDLRDSGFLQDAAEFLNENLDSVISTIEPSTESSQTCPLVIKATDLFVMGLGKDANQVTARLEDAYSDTHELTSVIFSDNGCWPDNPGGVSNCRRDLVNGHSSIRGHCLAESANDFGIPRYQIEQNINSLKILPLWGLDGKTPYHGVLDNLLQTQVNEKISNTRIEEDIEGVFIPILKSFVRGARMRRYTRADLITFSNDILRMGRYFEHCDYNKTWENSYVWDAWVEAWLYDYNDPNISNPRDFFQIEQPSLNDFREALNLYICYFFIYSVQLPAECPTVFQSTHHGISSLYGMLLKYRRGTTWGIWDHAILWRETCLNISPAQCLLPIPVQSMLLAGISLACHLAYTHVDIVLPCTSVFNPDWEIDLGTDQGRRGSRKSFARKIDPIVNGIGNMDAFTPVKETRSKVPTTVMLSNVQFIKDVKNAVLAADVIVNKYGFNTYQLVVYGAQDRQPSYALETTTLINNRGLSKNVILAGFGSPKEVLKDAWLFMNSSLSEGLPLAIGEAALSGIPIVATEVGATALVLTDPDDSSKRYGEVVPPNDPEALARAQLSILAMLGQWTQYTEDKIPPPPLPDVFKSKDVDWVTNRMYDKADDRRALGLKLRDVVLRSFHGSRYLREHEQMYWIQRGWAETRRSDRKLSRHPPVDAIFGEPNIYAYDDAADMGRDMKQRWQDFDADRVKTKDRVEPRSLV